ncbi:hypothetical protein SDC9_175740 [bioreactor metagenome]|uniref:Uncharacterized protein n=1 Tax=bioreactor metagenome TaxID=1076179 RepID=A0A645GQY2_9ZZZZ
MKEKAHKAHKSQYQGLTGCRQRKFAAIPGGGKQHRQREHEAQEHHQQGVRLLQSDLCPREAGAPKNYRERREDVDL